MYEVVVQGLLSQCVRARRIESGRRLEVAAHVAHVASHVAVLSVLVALRTSMEGKYAFESRRGGE